MNELAQNVRRTRTNIGKDGLVVDETASDVAGVSSTPTTVSRLDTALTADISAVSRSTRWPPFWKLSAARPAWDSPPSRGSPRTGGSPARCATRSPSALSPTVNSRSRLDDLPRDSCERPRGRHRSCRGGRAFRRHPTRRMYGLRELHLGADHGAGRWVLRHAVRDRSSTCAI